MRRCDRRRPGRATVVGRPQGVGSGDEGVLMGRFHRAIGVVVFGSAILGALLLGAAIALTGPGAGSRPDDGLLFGVWKVVYDTQAPSPRVMMAAFGLALVFAAGVAF